MHNETWDYDLPGFKTLVLTRKVGEQIMLTTPAGEEIIIGVAQIKGRQTRIAVRTKDKSVLINRMEVHAAIHNIPKEKVNAKAVAK